MNNPPPEQPSKKDYQQLQEFLLTRIYHEDDLLVQRTYYLLTAHAFLALALVTTLGFKDLGWLPYVFAYFGLLLSIFQTAWGIRTDRTIRFFRVYVNLVEPKSHFPVDSALDQFCETNDFVSEVLPREKITGGTGKRLYEAFPWNLIKSSNQLAGVGLPVALTFFWGLTLQMTWFYRVKDLLLGIAAFADIASLELAGKIVSLLIHLSCGICSPLIIALVVLAIHWRWGWRSAIPSSGMR